MKPRKFVNASARTAAGPRWIYGVHPVTEWLRSRPQQVRNVHYDTRHAEHHRGLLELAASAGVPLQPSDEELLTRSVGTRHHHGVIAAMMPFPYTDLDHVVQDAPRLLVVADQIQDPHNLGALLRTAEAVGVGALIIPKDGSVPITPVVEAASAGATALVPVCRVTNVARTLEVLKRHGYWSIGLDPGGGVELYEFEAPERAIVVVGGEAGLRPLVAKHCDFVVSIPMYGKVESLNAAVAAAVVLYELIRRWHQIGGNRSLTG